MTKVNVLVPFDADDLALVDKARGDVPRVKWIRGAVRGALAGGGVEIETAVRVPGVRAGTLGPVVKPKPVDRLPPDGEEKAMMNRVLVSVLEQRFTVKGLVKKLGADEGLVERAVRSLVRAGLARMEEGYVVGELK